ncbi:MAG TPA: hypothetical protein VLB49_08530 [Gemmatimonadales bacterium]|nr:hypothetical protein [Gemmatimonadales bacterium]
MSRPGLAAAQADTTRPPVPTELGAPAEILTLGLRAETIFRNVAEVRFDDTTSGVTVRNFLRRYGANIVGGTPISRAYILEIPDPGATWEKYYGVITAMRSEPGVTWVSIVSFGESSVNLPARPTPDMVSLVPDSPPDSIPMSAWEAMYAPKNMEPPGVEWARPFPRNIVVVLFREETSRIDKQRAIDSIQGVVVGGEPIGRGGYYYVRIPDDGTSRPLFRAIETLKSLPQVETASPVLPASDPLKQNSKRP